MSAHVPLSARALELIADDKIRAAYQQGEFDNLPRFGQPAAIIDEPYDTHWWLRRKLKAESMQPKLFPRIG
jgi:hypothetical protein